MSENPKKNLALVKTFHPHIQVWKYTNFQSSQLIILILSIVECKINIKKQFFSEVEVIENLKEVLGFP